MQIKPCFKLTVSFNAYINERKERSSFIKVHITNLEKKKNTEKKERN